MRQEETAKDPMSANDVEKSSKLAQNEQREDHIANPITVGIETLIPEIMWGQAHRLSLALKLFRREYPWDFLNLSCKLIGRAEEPMPEEKNRLSILRGIQEHEDDLVGKE